MLGFPLNFISINPVISHSEYVSSPRGVHYNLRVCSVWCKIVVALHWFISGLYFLYDIYSTCAITWTTLFTILPGFFNLLVTRNLYLSGVLNDVKSWNNTLSVFNSCDQSKVDSQSRDTESGFLAKYLGYCFLNLNCLAFPYYFKCWALNDKYNAYN